MVLLPVDEIVEKYGKGWMEKYKDESGIPIIEKVFGWPDNKIYAVVREEKQRKNIQKSLEKELEKIMESFPSQPARPVIKVISQEEYEKEWRNRMRIL